MKREYVQCKLKQMFHYTHGQNKIRFKFDKKKKQQRERQKPFSGHGLIMTKILPLISVIFQFILIIFEYLD